MKRIRLILAMAFLFLSHCICRAQEDTLKISAAYTTHLIFPSEITYADLSRPQNVAAKIVEQNRNMLAVKAREPFPEPTSISALESDGKMHTFIVVYDPSPLQLVIDLREGILDNSMYASRGLTFATMIAEISQSKRQLYHLGDREYGIEVMCENIISHNDMSYILLSLKNKTSVSYSITDATFVVESRRKGKRTVAFEKSLQPKNRHGELSATSGKSTRMAYSFDKLTLAKDQVLKIYLYEEDGQRNLEITLSSDDINKAIQYATRD